MEYQSFVLLLIVGLSLRISATGVVKALRDNATQSAANKLAISLICYWGAVGGLLATTAVLAIIFIAVVSAI